MKLPKSEDDRCYSYKSINNIIILCIVNVRLEGSNRTSLILVNLLINAGGRNLEDAIHVDL